MRRKKNTTPGLAALDNSMLSKLLAASGNPYAAIVEDIEENYNYFDTGSYSLNLLMSGSTRKGHPDNFITVLSGEAATGKSFFVIGMVREFIKRFPNGFVFVFESENAPTWGRENLKKIGINTNNLIKLPVTTIQETTTQALKIASLYESMPEEERPPCMMVLDSLGQLSTIKEMKDSESGKNVKDMTKSGLIKQFFRTLCQKLGRARIPMFVTNHVYDVIGSYVPMKAQGGGKGPIYTASTIIYLSKSKDKDSQGNINGVIITAKTEKGRLTKENMKVKTRISYTDGLDRYYGLLDLCEQFGVIKLVGKQYEFPNGVKAFKKTILESPEKYWTEEMLDIIDKEIGEKYFMYGGSGEVPQDTEETEETENE